MGALELFLLPARLAVLLGGLLLPGAALVRSLRLPFTFAGSFLASVTILTTSVVLFAVFRLLVTVVSLAAALALAATAALIVASRIPRRGGAPVSPEEISSFAALPFPGWWRPLYAAFWLIVLWRLGTQPLTGADVNFRWSWLAAQIVRLSSLHFYPPRTAAGYSSYTWPESIPPRVAALHA